MTVLRLLVENTGEVVTREFLLSSVWGEAEGSQEALTRAIYELRKALGQPKGSTEFIETISRRGYRFNAQPDEPVQTIREERALFPNGDEVGSNEAPADQEKPGGLPRSTLALSAALAITIAILIAFVGSSFVSQNAEKKPGIDPRVIRSALHILHENNRTAEDAIRAMIDARNFDQAILTLKDNYYRNQENYSISESIDKLHQIGAMAFYPDPESSMAAYKELIAMDAGDWLAAHQLARLHYARRERAEAAQQIERAMQATNAGELNQFAMKFTKLRIMSKDHSESSKAMYQLAEEAKAAGHMQVWADAIVYGIEYERRAIGQGNRDFSPLVPKLELIQEAVDYQLENHLDYRAAVSIASLGLIQQVVGQLEASEKTLLQALELENIIRRPTQQHAILSNLTICTLKLGEYDKAKSYNDQAIEVLRRSGKMSDIGFNLLMAAQIAKKTGEEQKACRQIRKAIRSFDPDANMKGRLLEIKADLGC